MNSFHDNEIQATYADPRQHGQKDGNSQFDGIPAVINKVFCFAFLSRDEGVSLYSCDLGIVVCHCDCHSDG